MNEDITDKDNRDAVAIIGLEGRFPGAENIDEFWNNLVEGKESLSRFKPDELDPGIPRELIDKDDYIPVRGVLPDADCFDAAFFGISPREAEILDPQHRVFMEMAWRALENAGYAPGTLDGLTGVFACMSNNTYYRNHVAKHPDVLELFGELPTMVANEKDYLATRVSYKLNLRGPSLSFSTACSSALVAVCHAFHSLLDYQCDVALAGGIAINCPQEQGYLFQQGGIYAKDGHCRAFDSAADGTVFSNGGGLVVLKRLDDAIADQDTIHAVIRGAAMNNDGAERVSLTAPGVSGQSQVVEIAQAFANVSPSDISYIEAHGTGTPLGDPIEFESLTRAFRRETKEKQFCALGSVKPAIGHLDVAAGIAGLLKTVLALKHRRIPGTVNYHWPNPEIALQDSPFYISGKSMPWKPVKGKRIAGISAFGLGGTNAHVVVEEAPSLVDVPVARARHADMLPVSAKTRPALARNLALLADALVAQKDINLADVAFTLQAGRAPLAKRAVIVAGSKEQAIESLRAAAANATSGTAFDGAVGTNGSVDTPAVVFMFPGQGVQKPGMMAEIYREEPVFRDAVDACANVLSGEIDHDIRDLVFGRHPDSAALLDQTRYTQPALFTVEYALARLWMSWGIRPDILVGHSIGEFPAATLAGVFRLQDALRLVAARGQLMWQQARGSMLSVRLSEDELQPWLKPGVTIAALNGPQLSVVSGASETLESLATQLAGKDIPHSLLRTSHAFHSAAMDPVVDAIETHVAGLELSPPHIPIASTMTGRLLSDEEAVDPKYWARQLREPVRFQAAIETILSVLPETTPRLILDVGPGLAATTFARQIVAGIETNNIDTTLVLASIGTADSPAQEYLNLLQAAGNAWVAGANVDWEVLRTGRNGHRIPLPGYSFERTRYWLPSTGVREEVADEVATPEEGMEEGDLLARLGRCLVEASGTPLERVSATRSFASLGMDSLFLIQFSQLLRKRFGVDLRVRQLMGEFDTLQAIAGLVPANHDAVQSEKQVPESRSSSAAATRLRQGNEEPSGHDEIPAPIPGARLGRRPDGSPAWFIPDPDQPGTYREMRTGK